MTIAVLCLLAVTTGYALLFGGAVEREHWRVCQAGVGAAAMLSLGLGRRREAFAPIDRRAVWLAAGAFAWVALQVVPLPIGWVALVSPVRAELSKALTIAGTVPDWITLSAAPSATRAMLVKWIAAGAVFLVAREAGARSRYALVPLIAVVALEAAIGMVQLTSGAPVQGTSGNRNHFAAAMNLALPVALAAAVSAIESKQMAPALAAGLTATLLAASSLASLSRTGFAVTAICLGAILWRAVRHRVRPAAALLLAAGAVPAAFAFAPGALVDRFSGGDDRIRLWSDSLGIVRDYPVTGCGLGAYEPVFLKYKKISPDRTADYAHNDYLQLIAETGPAGFLLLAAAICFLLRPAFAGGGWTRAGSAISLAGAAIHGFTDYPLYIPANLLLFSWVAGVSSLGPRRTRTHILKQ